MTTISAVRSTPVRTGRKRADYSATAFGCWVDASGLTLQQIAERLLTVPSQVRRWAIGEVTPSEHKRAMIFEASGGAVDPHTGYRTVTAPPDDGAAA